MPTLEAWMRSGNVKIEKWSGRGQKITKAQKYEEDERKKI